MLIAYSPIAAYRCIIHKRYRKGWKHRFGNITRKYSQKKCIWLHAVSLGEINAAKTVIESLCSTISDCEIVISTNTDTGMARAETLYGSKFSIFYFPFDFSFISRKVFRRLQPNMILLVELEVWPNLVFNAYKNNIPVIVINGRLSDKSFPKYKKVKMLIKPVFEKLTLAVVQTKEYAQRFVELGCHADRVIVAGSLKYDTAEISIPSSDTQQIINQLKIDGQQLIVAGGTGNGEEKIILDCFGQLKTNLHNGNLRLVIVPRKPERFNEVASLIAQNGFSFLRFSDYKANSLKIAQDRNAVILVDTMGDLRKFYAIATVNIVGRSLVDMGGSDMIESAAMGKFTIFGKYTYNFRQSAEDLLKNNGAVKVENTIELYNTIEKALTNNSYRRQIEENGKNVVLNNKGATQKTIEILKNIFIRKF